MSPSLWGRGLLVAAASSALTVYTLDRVFNHFAGKIHMIGDHSFKLIDGKLHYFDITKAKNLDGQFKPLVNSDLSGIKLKHDGHSLAVYQCPCDDEVPLFFIVPVSNFFSKDTEPTKNFIDSCYRPLDDVEDYLDAVKHRLEANENKN